MFSLCLLLVGDLFMSNLIVLKICLNLELARVQSHTRLRELVIEAFRGIASDISRIKTHSLRSGRPTLLPLMPGCSGSSFKFCLTAVVLRLPPNVTMLKIILRHLCLFLRRPVFSACLRFDDVFILVGLARGIFWFGEQLARGFPLRSKWTYGEVFNPALVP